MPEKRTQVTATPGGQEVTITRTFNAPPDRLWAAYTEAELYAKWQGPDYLTTVIKDWEAQPGGKWSYVSTNREGQQFGFHGFFHLVEQPKCLVQTFEFEGAPGHVSMNTVTFEPEGDRTKVTTAAVFQSPEDRDAMVQSGMELGVQEGNDRLAKLVENT